jgi:ArsR family transcriptional regulator, arsenate/arsenite/antimonite-responsive transcriptional repressor
MSIGDLFKALSDQTRREILQLLKEKDLTPTEMLEKLSVTQPTLSHHLDILKRADLVHAEREGQFIRYSIDMTVFQMAMEYMVQFTNKGEKS